MWGGGKGGGVLLCRATTDKPEPLFCQLAVLLSLALSLFRFLFLAGLHPPPPPVWYLGNICV